MYTIVVSVACDITGWHMPSPNLSVTLVLNYTLSTFTLHINNNVIMHERDDNHNCDWACKNPAYLHKLHMFRK